MGNRVHENSHLRSYFSAWLKSSHITISVFYQERSRLEIGRVTWLNWWGTTGRKGLATKLRAFLIFIFCVSFFCSVFLLYSELIPVTYFSHNYYNYSIMFRNDPECSGMFHVPDFINGLLPQSLRVLMSFSTKGTSSLTLKKPSLAWNK